MKLTQQEIKELETKYPKFAKTYKLTKVSLTTSWECENVDAYLEGKTEPPEVRKEVIAEFEKSFIIPIMNGTFDSKPVKYIDGWMPRLSTKEFRKGGWRYKVWKFKSEKIRPIVNKNPILLEIFMLKSNIRRWINKKYKKPKYIHDRQPRTKAEAERLANGTNSGTN